MAEAPPLPEDYARQIAKRQADIEAVGYVWAPEEHVARCPFCLAPGGSPGHPLTTGLDRYGFEVGWVDCEVSQGFFLTPRLSERQTAEFYGQGWYRKLLAAHQQRPDLPQVPTDVQAHYGAWLWKGVGFRRACEGFVARTHRTPRVLDVGSSSGAVVRPFREGGCFTVGLDPAIGEGGGCACHVGLKGTLEAATDVQVLAPAGCYEIILLAETIDHLREPRRGLEKLRRWLAPAGALWVDISDIDTWRELHGAWRWVRKCDHPVNLREATLRYLLAETGFEVVTWIPTAQHGVKGHCGAVARRTR